MDTRIPDLKYGFLKKINYNKYIDEKHVMMEIPSLPDVEIRGHFELKIIDFWKAFWDFKQSLCEIAQIGY